MNNLFESAQLSFPKCLTHLRSKILKPFLPILRSSLIFRDTHQHIKKSLVMDFILEDLNLHRLVVMFL